MPIKFNCPHCQRAIAVKDHYAGRRGACPGCKQIVTIPSQSTAAAAAKPPTPPQAKAAPPPVPPKAVPPPVDVEAEAAALFSDEPPPSEPAEVKTLDFNCPYCDEPIQLSADLAGKRAPCPECKHIIKVPEIVKKDPKDWRKVNPRGPSGARLPDQPAPEGTWASTAASTVGRKTLEEAGVIAAKLPPRTTWEKFRWPVYGAATLLVLASAGWFGYRWWTQRGAERALKEALAYAASPDAAKEVQAVGQAALALGAGEYYLNSNVSKSGEEASKQLGKALNLLQSAPESHDREALLIDLALTWIGLGGEGEDVRTDRRLTWEEIQKRLLATLTQVKDAEARREAVRLISQRLFERGQGAKVLPLVRQVYSAADTDRAAALSVAGLELLKANDRPSAEKAAEEAIAMYEVKTDRPPLRREVITLAMILQRKPPPAGEEPDDKREEYLGRVEGLARTEQWDHARKQAAPNDLGEDTQFLALLAIAAAAGDQKSPDNKDIDAAIKFAATKLRDKPELAWPLLRLIRITIRAGVPEEDIQALTKRISNNSLRGRAQLELFRSRLAQSKQAIEDSAADKIDATSLARRLAAEDLSRHNARLNAGWSAVVQGWPPPLKAFGSVGIALGLQDRERR